jgi:hypothetical protein
VGDEDFVAGAVAALLPSCWLFSAITPQAPNESARAATMASFSPDARVAYAHDFVTFPIFAILRAL